MEPVSSDVNFDLEYFFELSPDLLCVAGFDGYFKKINPAVSKLLGYSKEELFAAPIISFVHPDDQQMTAQKRGSVTKGEPLLNFENRYIAKDGSIVWLSWTSMPINRDKVVFAIAKNITYRKKVEEYERISAILEMINKDHIQRFKLSSKVVQKTSPPAGSESREHPLIEPSHSDQLWLGSFEAAVRKYVGKMDLNLSLIGNELAISERQLFRQVNRILGITPNKLVRIIRLHLAWEAIASGKHHTIKEISLLAGYQSRAHFSKIFKEIYGVDVGELL